MAVIRRCSPLAMRTCNGPSYFLTLVRFDEEFLWLVAPESKHQVAKEVTRFTYEPSDEHGTCGLYYLLYHFQSKRVEEEVGSVDSKTKAGDDMSVVSWWAWLFKLCGHFRHSDYMSYLLVVITKFLFALISHMPKFLAAVTLTLNFTNVTISRFGLSCTRYQG